MSDESLIKQVNQVKLVQIDSQIESHNVLSDYYVQYGERNFPQDEFEDKKKNESKLLVVDFYATWCGPCKMIAPKLQEMAKEFSDVMFLKVDVDEEEDLAQSCGISAMPTFQLYKGGQKVGEITGANADKLKELIMEKK